MITIENSKRNLEHNGHFKDVFPLSDTIKYAVTTLDWDLIDKEFQALTNKTGSLFKYLNQFCDFNSIEFIISIRDSGNEWEEDGIWHDDGSRVMAFSLSLMFDPKPIEGGVLEIRRRGKLESIKIPPFEFGEIVVFLTGTSGYEHKINAVTKGVRIIIAGWCS
jgi:hypothetical protein